MISVLFVAHEDRSAVEATIPVLHALLKSHYRQFELICIDNGSRDGTQLVLLEALGRLPNLRYVRLTRPHPAEVAAACALDQAVGDIAVIFDPVTDNPASVPLLVAAAATGAIAVARRDRHPTWVRSIAATVFYRIAHRALGFPLLADEGNQRAYPRSVLSALTRIKNRRRNLRYYTALVGFAQQMVDVPNGDGVRHETLGKAIGRSLDLLFTNSVRPLRWAAGLGLLAALGNACYLTYILAVAALKDHVAEGWVTQSLTTTGMFLVLFIMLAVLAEYVGRILEEVQERPLYFVEFERDGAVEFGAKTLNVV
jgi:dolichol-phosphate mannosyltransferase